MKAKTKLAALLLACMLTVSLLTIPAAAADTVYGGNPYDPVVLETGTVVVEDQSPKLLHVFMQDRSVVTMDERFVLDYMSRKAEDKRFTSRGGYTWLAKAAIDRAISDKTVTRSSDGKTCLYGDKAIHLATADGQPLPVDYLITNFFRQPVKDFRTLDTVNYEGGRNMTASLTVRAYGETAPKASGTTNDTANDPTTYPVCEIWKVRELDSKRIEVYVRNGMIVTMEKQMLVDWVDARQRLGKDFNISYWHDRWEMNDDGAEAYMDFLPTLLDTLIIKGWTIYPAEAVQPNYSHRAYPSKDIMWSGVKTDQVLIRALERLRTEDTTSDITVYFDYDYYNTSSGWWTDSTSYQMSVEFICRNIVPSSTSKTGNFNFYSLARPEYFLKSFNAAQSFRLTDDELKVLKGLG